MNQVARDTLLRKLVTTGHLNVPERREFEATGITRAEVIAAVAASLAESNYFPPHAVPRSASPNTVPYEGAILERLEGARYRLYLQGYRADLDGVQVYETIQPALRAYMEYEWPHDNIDGLPISG